MHDSRYHLSACRHGEGEAVYSIWLKRKLSGILPFASTFRSNIAVMLLLAEVPQPSSAGSVELK